MTKELETKFPAIYANEEKEAKDILIIAKFFCPGATGPGMPLNLTRQPANSSGLSGALKMNWVIFPLKNWNRSAGLSAWGLNVIFISESIPWPKPWKKEFDSINFM